MYKLQALSLQQCSRPPPHQICNFAIIQPPPSPPLPLPAQPSRRLLTTKLGPPCQTLPSYYSFSSIKVQNQAKTLCFGPIAAPFFVVVGSVWVTQSECQRHEGQCQTGLKSLHLEVGTQRAQNSPQNKIIVSCRKSHCTCTWRLCTALLDEDSSGHFDTVLCAFGTQTVCAASKT